MTKHKQFKGRAGRIIRGGEYAFFIFAAIVTLISPSNIIFGIFSQIPFFAYFWSVLFIFGSVACLYGVIKKNWVGEYSGLPGIITCLFLYAVGCFIDTPNLSTQRVFLGLIFFGFLSWAISRRQDVKLQKRIAEYEQRKNSGGLGV